MKTLNVTSSRYGQAEFFYTKALKALKLDYWNLVIVSHIYVRSLFEFQPIKKQ